MKLESPFENPYSTIEITSQRWPYNSFCRSNFCVIGQHIWDYQSMAVVFLCLIIKKKNSIRKSKTSMLQCTHTTFKSRESKKKVTWLTIKYAPKARILNDLANRNLSWLLQITSINFLSFIYFSSGTLFIDLYWYETENLKIRWFKDIEAFRYQSIIPFVVIRS